MLTKAYWVLTQVSSNLTVTNIFDQKTVKKCLKAYTVILATSKYSWLGGNKYVTQLKKRSNKVVQLPHVIVLPTTSAHRWVK